MSPPFPPSSSLSPLSTMAEKISPGDKKEGITQYAPPLLPRPKSDSWVSLPCVHSMGINGHEIQRAVKGREIGGRCSRFFGGRIFTTLFCGDQERSVCFSKISTSHCGKMR